MCSSNTNIKIELHLFPGAGSEFWAKERRARICIRRMCKQQWWFWLVIVLVGGKRVNTFFHFWQNM